MNGVRVIATNNALDQQFPVPGFLQGKGDTRRIVSDRLQFSSFNDQ